jgi:DNA-binding PadR family transcriptional regulator
MHRHDESEDRVFVRRRHRRGPFDAPFGGPFGPPFGPGGRGTWGGRGGRRRRGDVRLALLMLLQKDGPANGYQLMQGLEQRSDGNWRPSPGSVYPALSQLEDEGLIRSVQREGETGTTFELTDAGSEHLQERGEERAPWETPEEEDQSPRWALRNAMVSTLKAVHHVGQDGDPGQIEDATKILDDARRRLYRLLAGDEE